MAGDSKNDSTTSPPAARANKRKRTAQACGPCRTKKTKCDGIHPACTPCTNLGYACSYPLDSSAPVASTVMVTKDYLSALEARLMRLESRPDGSSQDHRSPGSTSARSDRHSSSRRGVSPRSRPRDSAVTFDDRSDGGRHGNDSAGAYSGPASGSPIASFVPPSGVGELSSTTGSAHLDGMGLLLTRERKERRTEPTAPGTAVEEVYGETSGPSFHRLLIDTLLPAYGCLARNTAGGDDVSAISERGVDEPVGFLGLPPPPDLFTVRSDDLPARVESREMFAFYRSHTWQVYPFIDMEALGTSYENLLDEVAAYGQGALDVDTKSPPKVHPLRAPSNQPLIALHFVIFALVKALYEVPFTKVDVLRVALRMLRDHLDWPRNTLKVQVLLMGTLVMQGMDCPEFSWDLLGYAIRTAYAVGLHDDAVNKRFGPMEREIRLRTWWGCYTLDRLLTVSIGRPSAINVDVYSLPLPRALPGEPADCIEFFAESIRLYRSLSDLMSNPPATFRGASPELLHGVVESTYRLEKEYAVWCDGVHRDFNFVDAPPNNPLGTVLALRGLTLRLLLHRRVMLSGIRDYIGSNRSRSGTPGQTSSLRFLEARQRELCFGLSLGIIIDTSVLTAQILERNGTDFHQLSAPWYLLFYAMNAFMSLVATFLLDLSKWATFIRKPGGLIVSSLHSIHDFVRDISDRYRRPSARQALQIIESLLQALGLSWTQQAGGVHLLAGAAGVAQASQNGNSAFTDPNLMRQASGNSDFANVMGFSLQDLPHLDFDELSKNMGLDPTMTFDLGDFGFQL